MLSLNELLQRLYEIFPEVVKHPSEAAVWQGKVEEIQAGIDRANQDSELTGLEFHLQEGVSKIAELNSAMTDFIGAAGPFSEPGSAIYGLRRDVMHGDHVVESAILAYFLMLPEFPQILFILDKESFNSVSTLFFPGPAVESAAISHPRQ